MSEISFDENKYKIKSRTIFGQAEIPKMINFLKSKGIVKNNKQGKAVLLFLTLSFFIASVVVFMMFVLDVKLFTKEPVQTQEQIQMIEKLREQAQNNTTNTQ